MNQKKIFRLCRINFVITITLLLNACTTLGIMPSHEPASASFVQAQQERVRQVKSWKLSAQVQARKNNQSGRLKVVWIESAERYKIRASAITGMTLALIKGEVGGEASAIDSRGMRYYADNARQLIKQLLGIDVPVEYLRYWVLGSPVPDITTRDARQAEGRLVSFTQKAWRVSYRYHEPRSGKSPALAQISIRSGRTLLIIDIRNLQKA